MANPKSAYNIFLLPEYKLYSENIRKEYMHYSWQDYRIGRKKVLKTLLLSPNIFASDLFDEEKELQARQNISWEIDELLSGTKENEKEHVFV